VSGANNTILDINKAVALGFFDALNRRAFQDAVNMADKDAGWWSLTTRRTKPVRDTVARIKSLASTLTEDGLTFEVGTVTAEQDRVAVTAVSHAQFTDGRVYNNHYHFLFSIEGALIANISEYHDTGHANEVLRAPSNRSAPGDTQR
jgi:uncharacterized protein